MNARASAAAQIAITRAGIHTAFISFIIFDASL
jgi:hypothetical protein